MQETRVQALVQEDPLKEKMATHSNILAWKIPWTEEPGGLQSMELQRVEHDWNNLASIGSLTSEYYHTLWLRQKDFQKQFEYQDIF